MFELDETQRMVEHAAREWCEKELGPRVPALESGEALPYDLMRSLSQSMGLASLLEARARKRIATLRAEPEKKSDRVGAEEGKESFGDDPMLTSLLLKEISRVSPGFGMALIATIGCGMAILARGSAETIERYALPVLRFEKIGAWALTEPGAGSDAFGGMRTVARVDGDTLVLDGQKTFITNAPYADVFAIYARVVTGRGGRPVRAVIVERGTEGLDTGPPMRKMGMHDSPTGEVFLRECRVPTANLIGTLERDAGARGGAALETLHLERAVMPAMCLGIIERCTEESVRYARLREQFGRPIGEFQGVGFKLARMEVALENARNLVAKLAWAQLKGKLDARLASVAKLYCAEEAVRAALDAIQIHGGAGYMAELPFEKLARDAKMFEIGGGTNEIQLDTIARWLQA
jgi:alkylation response protein AidB-like acyl-CoA dehydrogenase